MNCIDGPQFPFITEYEIFNKSSMQIESKHACNMVAGTKPYVFSIGCVHETISTIVETATVS